jgi:hypothetical protein
MNETFCKLQDVSGEFVAVNPRHVRYIRRQKAPSDDACVVYFDNEHCIAVVGGVEKIAIALGSGLIDQSQKRTAAAMQIAEK